MEEKQATRLDNDGVKGLAYPIEFELRVVYIRADNPALAADLKRVLDEHGASPDEPRELPVRGTIGSSTSRYGRLACSVTFMDKESMYAAYRAVGALSGVKAVL